MLPPQSFVLVLEGFLVTVSESVPVLKYVIFLEAVSVPFLFLEYFPVPNIGVVPVTIVVLEVSLSVVFFTLSLLQDLHHGFWCLYWCRDYCYHYCTQRLGRLFVVIWNRWYLLTLWIFVS